MHAYDSYISGRVLALIPGLAIRQTWRTTDWPSECPDSHLEIRLAPGKGGTRLTLIQRDVPAERARDYAEGWHEYSWKPLREYLTR